jgi:BA14K-like protein
MKLIVYFFVALIAAGSVLFGLDFVSAPMSPMPASKYALRAAAPPPAPVVAEVKNEPKTEAAASAAVASVVAAKMPVAVAPPAVPAPRAPNALDQQPASIAVAEPGRIAAAPRCDVDACASAYRTFDATDCTYKPSEGPRRLCTKGTPPAAATPSAATPSTATPSAATPSAAAPATPDVRAQACNIAACAQSYPRSFSAADCTFLPAEGPRRVCTK